MSRGPSGRGPGRGSILPACALACALATGQAAAAVDLLPADALRPGMKGTARTVFEGNQIEEFGVEILGVLKNAIGPQQDLILARLRGTHVEYTGVVSGMSGSPVYVDGKLIGAVSYRLGPFGKEAIAGITPIADMLRVGPGAKDAVRRAAAAPDLLGRFLASAAGAPGEPLAPSPAPSGWPGPAAAAADLRPIGTPLVCSGCEPSVLRYYAPIFESRGLEPASGGGASSGEPATMPLDPGTAIGGALVTGDLSLTGIGTLTYVDGGRVFAFGHPLLGAGPLEMPMVQAQILATFPSEAASFKIANATAPIGTILGDGLTAIMGEVGRVTPMIPVTVKVSAPGAGRVFHYDVLRHRAWSPVMVALVTANSLMRTTDFDAAATLAVRYRIDLEGYPELRVGDLYASSSPAQPAHIEAANDAGGLFNLLYNNRFEEPRVRAVEVEADLLPPNRLAAVTSLRASAPAVRPGEPFTVTAGLTAFRGDEREVAFEVRLPEDTTPGETEIIVGGGPVVEGIDRRILERQAAQAGGLRDLMRLVARSKKADGLYLRVSRRSPSAIVKSDILPDLPLSIFSVFNNPRLSADATLMVEAPILELERDLDLVAVGGRRISIKVK
jgi:hypothetical protein